MNTFSVIAEKRVGETRAVAMNADGVPVSLFLERWADKDRLTLGSDHKGRVTTSDAGPGGLFVQLEGGQTVYLRLSRGQKAPPEGTSVVVRVMAEARGDKHARVALTEATGSDADALARWAQKWGVEADALVEVDDPSTITEIDAAFDEALSVSVGIPGGGRLTIEPTRALTAIDVDTAGTRAAGEINLRAVAEVARQVSLRGLGGLFVLDCVAPVSEADGKALRSRLQKALSSCRLGEAIVIAPSRLGLLEFSLPWRRTPIAERLLDGGEPSLETRAIAAIAELERAGQADRGATLRLGVPSDLLGWLGSPPFDWQAALAERIGPRFALDPVPAPRVSVSAS